MVVRKITKFLRGKATRGQVLTASVLAGMLGFVPGFFLPSDLGGGFLQAPGLILSLFFLALVCNANFGVFAIVTVVAKLASFALLPITFAIGRWMIDGPMRGLVQWLANAPVTAWFGLDYYATTGGLVTGLLFGTATGIVMWKSLQAYRNRMAALEAGSPAYQQYSKKWYVKLLTWLFLGGGKGDKVTWQELAEGGKKQLPIRIGGVAVVLVVVALLWLTQSKLSQGALTSGVRSALLAANGATVDLEAVELDFADGAFRVRNLAIADASKLETNLFEVAGFEAKIDSGALLSKRIVVDNLEIEHSKSGTARQTKGELVTPPPPPPPPADATQPTLDDYLKDIEIWRERLRVASEWIEKFSGGDTEDPSKTTEEQKQKDLEQQIAEVGLAKVVATGIRNEQPLVWVKQVKLKGVARADAPGGAVDITLSNWSSNPWTLETPPSVSVESADKSLRLDVAGPSKKAAGGGLSMSLNNLPVDTVFANIKTSGKAPVRGGMMDLAITEGSIEKQKDAPAAINLTVSVTMRDTTFAIAGTKETKIDSLTLPLALKGPVTRPSVSIEDKALADALVNAGKQELANFVNGQAGKLLKGVPQLDGVIDANKSVQENLDAAKQRAEEEAKKAIDAAKQQAEEAAKKAIEDAAKKAAEDAAKKAAEDAAKKAAKDKLKGLLPGGGKKDGGI